MSKRSLLGAAVLSVTFLGVVVTTGCATEQDGDGDEVVGTSADALVMACGTTGRTAYGPLWNNQSFSTGYLEADSEAQCNAMACTAPTAKQWADAKAAASARGSDWCKFELSRHQCPSGCLLTTTKSCWVADATEESVRQKCAKNGLGKWQTDCRYVVVTEIRGSAKVTCGAVGSAPDAGTTSVGDGGASDATDSGPPPP